MFTHLLLGHGNCVFSQVVMLKVLWDMVWLVRSNFSDWNKTLWSDINVEQMEAECKKFVKVRCTCTYTMYM